MPTHQCRHQEDGRYLQAVYAQQGSAPTGALPSVVVGEQVHIDVIIMAVEAATGERVIAQAIDGALRWITSKALHTRETKPICEWFYNSWILIKGIPQRVTIDGEGALISKVAECLFDLLGVHLRVTSLDNPMSNGMVERPHQHYLEMLKCLAQPDMSDWPSFVSAADFVHTTEYWYLTVLPGVRLQAIHAVEHLCGGPAAWTRCHGCSSSGITRA